MTKYQRSNVGAEAREARLQSSNPDIRRRHGCGGQAAALGCWRVIRGLRAQKRNQNEAISGRKRGGLGAGTWRRMPAFTMIYRVLPVLGGWSEGRGKLQNEAIFECGGQGSKFGRIQVNLPTLFFATKHTKHIKMPMKMHDIGRNEAGLAAKSGRFIYTGFTICEPFDASDGGGEFAWFGEGKIPAGRRPTLRGQCRLSNPPALPRSVWFAQVFRDFQMEMTR